MKEKSHNRAPGMTQVTVPIPADLLEKIVALAKKERRNKTELMRLMLIDSVAIHESTQQATPRPLPHEPTRHHSVAAKTRK